MARPRSSRRLTGIDADRLKEEKARGITIDLGFAYKATADGGVLGFVDVPGHERLVRNMLAGATGIDHVLLVVAADDGPMPQTREHLAILDLLGLARGAVVLTKSDLVSAARLAEVRAEIEELLRPTGLAGSAGVCGLQRHRPGHRRTGAASAAGPAERRRPPPADGHFRLAVDRCFSLAGIGTVVTGTAVSGRVAVGDRVLVSPRKLPVRVRGLHAQNRESTQGQAGQRLALNLAATGLEKSDIARGDWIVAEAAHVATRRIDARMRLLPGEARDLAHWTPVHLHLGACDVGARVVLLEGPTLAPGGQRAWCNSSWTARLPPGTATASSCATSLRRAPWAAAWCWTRLPAPPCGASRSAWLPWRRWSTPPPEERCGRCWRWSRPPAWTSTASSWPGTCSRRGDKPSCRPWRTARWPTAMSPACLRPANSSAWRHR